MLLVCVLDLAVFSFCSLLQLCLCMWTPAVMHHHVLFVLQMKEAIMNQEKLAKLQAQVRIGGKVTFFPGL